MGMFNNGVCPICQSKTTLINKSGMKIENQYICQHCSSKLLKNNIGILNYKKYTLEDLKKVLLNENKISTISDIKHSNNEIPPTESNYIINQKDDEEKQKRKEEKRRKREQEEAEFKKHYEEKMNVKKIKQVMIVANETDTRKKVGSSIVRGAVGSFALGPVGLVGGAISGKNKVTSKTTFLIEYMDGHRETKTVDNNSSEFNKLCKYIKMQ